PQNANLGGLGQLLGVGPSYDLNQATLQGLILPGSGCNPIKSKVKTVPCVELDSRKRFFNFGWTQPITYLGNDASANYNALQVRVDKRFTHGYQIQASYAYAKGLGYASDYFAIDP